MERQTSTTKKIVISKTKTQRDAAIEAFNNLFMPKKKRKRKPVYNAKPSNKST
jgi:hypothetical protein